MACNRYIRNFNWNDLESLVNLLNKITISVNETSSIDLELGRQMLSQPSSNPEQNCYIAEIDNILVGYTIITPELPIQRAVISGGVINQYRRAGIGRALLKASIEQVIALHSSVLHVQTEFENTSAKCLYETCGFQPVRNYSRMTWSGETVPIPKLPAGFYIRSFGRKKDAEILTELQNTVFNGSWGFSPNSVEQIKTRLQFKTSDPEGIILATSGSEDVAYNWTLRDPTDTHPAGRISMTGVRPDHRNLGLGRAVVLSGMQFLKSKGVKIIELEVDQENKAAIELYRSIGFQTSHNLIWYEKILDYDPTSRLNPRSI